MSIDLSEQQRQAVRNGEPVRLAVADIGEDIVLLRASQFDALREILDEERERQAILSYSMKQAAAVARENPY